MDAHRGIENNYTRQRVTLASEDKQFSGQCPQQVNDHHATTTLPIELTNAPVTHLDHLNEHCLMEIFSRKSLSPMDLVSLADTCKLFKRIAKSVFPKKLKFTSSNSEYVITANGYARGLQRVQDVDKMLKNFGSRLVAVSIYGQEVFGLIDSLAKHCVVGTLKELEIGRIKITDAVAAALEPVLRQLQKLCIRDDSIFDCSVKRFANCDALIELSATNYGILQNNFPALQRFIFDEEDDLYRTGYYHVLDDFLYRHKTVTSLHLSTHAFHLLDIFVSEIGYHCEALEEFSVRFRIGPICSVLTLDFSKFRRLKRPSLHCTEKFLGRPTIVQLQNVKSLEMLSISGAFNGENFLEDLPLPVNLRELNVDLYSYKEEMQWTSLSQLAKLRLSTQYRRNIGNVAGIIKN